MKIASWNVLAAPWALPVHYPKQLDPALLTRDARCDRTVARMVGLDEVADVWCLQEATGPELAKMHGALDRAADALAAQEFGHAPNGDQLSVAEVWDPEIWDPEIYGVPDSDICGSEQAYARMHAQNGREYWAHWLGDDVAWEANGPAVIVRRDAFDDLVLRELYLGGFGNAAAMMQAIHYETDTRVRCVSVHLDADHHAVRMNELQSLLAQLDDASDNWRNALTIVAGDFNCDTQDGEIAELLANAGYVDAHASCGQFDPTHPYARPGDTYAPLARIDHIMVRGAPVTRAIVDDVGVWEIAEPGDRLIEHLRRTGTDHLQISATFRM